MSNRNKRSDTKKLTMCAMLSALGVILLYIGSIIDVLDISMAVLASLACIIAVIEYGKSAPWAIYGVTTVLSLILLPNKTPAVFYAVFFGFYPILKEKLERKPKLVCWMLKELVFNVCLAIIITLYMLLFFQGFSIAIPLPWLIVAAVLLCEVIQTWYQDGI